MISRRRIEKFEYYLVKIAMLVLTAIALAKAISIELDSLLR
jgi:hypothetical protein